MIRLLKTPIIGISATIAGSSSIDMFGGRAIGYTRRMPPGFCAKAGFPATSIIDDKPARETARKKHRIASSAVTAAGLLFDSFGSPLPPGLQNPAKHQS